MGAQPTIECVQGDIAQQPDMEAVVNAANADLTIGGGVAGALHRAAGPGLEEECRSMAPIQPGQAVISGAHNLPNRYVIHCLGPVYGVDEPADKLLASCYLEAIRLAEDKGLTSIVFPSLSTGAFGYPMPDATRIALDTVMQASRASHSLQRIRFVLFSEDAVRIHQEILGSLQSP